MISKPFTEYLKQFTQYAADLEAGGPTHEQFAHCQGVWAAALEDQNAGRISYEERKIIDKLYFYLKPEFREQLDLDRVYKCLREPLPEQSPISLPATGES